MKRELKLLNEVEVEGDSVTLRDGGPCVFPLDDN